MNQQSGSYTILWNVPTGEDRSITHASKTLAKAEQNYSHLEKEAFALVFGVTKLH